MTVSTTHSIVTLIYSGPGQYDFTFPIFETSDLVVNHVQSSNVTILLQEGTDFTVTLNPDGTGHIDLTYNVTPYNGEI
jgi:hypothetical protein